MKRNKRITLLILGAVALSAVVAGTRLPAQNQKNVQAESQKKEEPTVVREGQMTEKQRQHSKLFKHSGTKLRDLAARKSGDVEIEEGLGLTTTLPATVPNRPVFQSAVCNADAVVIGILNDKASQLTDDGNFVFTDYQITVQEVIKDNAMAPVPAAGVITGTRDGGVVELNDRIFRAKREDFDPRLSDSVICFFFVSFPLQVHT